MDWQEFKYHTNLKLKGDSMTDCKFCSENIDPERQAFFCSKFNFCPHCGTPINEDLAEKEELWIKFSAEVASKAVPEAIEEYGDLSDDGNLDELSTKDLIRKLEKIVSKYSCWGWEDNDDLLHLAHFVALIHHKAKEA